MRAPRVRIKDLPKSLQDAARAAKRAETADLQRKFDMLCLDNGVPRPRYEHAFHPPRKWRFDAAWKHYKVALEVEGGIWTGGRHTRPAGFLGDMEKYNAAARLGWRVLRCTPAEFLTLGTVELIRATLFNERS